MAATNAFTRLGDAINSLIAKVTIHQEQHLPLRTRPNEEQESIQFVVAMNDQYDGKYMNFGQVQFGEFQKLRMIRPSFMDPKVQSGMGLVGSRGITNAKISDNWQTMIGVMDLGNKGLILVVYDLQSGARRLHINFDRYNDPQNSRHIDFNNLSEIK